MHKNARQRLQVLEILYLAFEANPKAYWVGVRELKKLGDIEFALTALQKLGQAERSGFNWQITGAGMLEYESEAGENHE